MEEGKYKECFKCGKTLPISEFYVHKQMNDGHIGKCKDCSKKDVSKREMELRKNPEWVAKERQRGREKYYKYGNKKPNKDKKREATRRYRQKFPEKYMAAKYTEIFLIKTPGMNLHHWSYDQNNWLDVLELTIKDHNLLHRHLIYIQETMMFTDLDGRVLEKKEDHLEYLEKIKYGSD